MQVTDGVGNVTADGLTPLSDTYDYTVTTTGTANHAPVLDHTVYLPGDTLPTGDSVSGTPQPGVTK